MTDMNIIEVPDRIIALENLRMVDRATAESRDASLEAKIDGLAARVERLESSVSAMAVMISDLTARMVVVEGGATPPPPPVPELENLSVVFTFAAGPHIEFRQDQAVDQGIYDGPFVKQRSLVERVGEWVVFFRPDVSGGRQEVVVELGIWPTPATIAPYHQAEPFVVTIYNDGVQVAEIHVPFQFWNTRWRWQSSPRLIVRSPSDLEAMKALMLPDARALYGTEPPYSEADAVWTGPMGTAGLTTAMGTAGGRPEIGYTTEAQAEYLMTTSEASRIAMMAQAEAVGSFPIYLRDVRTEALVNIYDNPYIGYLNDAVTHKQVYPSYPKTALGATHPQFFQCDNSHYDPVAFVPWMLTDDPYLLEGCQAGAIFCTTVSNIHAVRYKLPGLCYMGTPRGQAWSLREIVRMAGFCPVSTPSWLLPRSVFDRQLADNRKYVGYGMASDLKTCRVFHTFSECNYAWPAFHGHYMATVLGNMKWSGLFPDWDNVAEWYAEPVLRQLDAPSAHGFDRRWPAPYYMLINNARRAQLDPTIDQDGGSGPNATNRSGNLPLDQYCINTMTALGKTMTPAQRSYMETTEANTPDSYEELFALFVQGSNLRNRPITLGTEDRIYENIVDNPASAAKMYPNYSEQTAAALAIYTQAGIAGARDRWQWLRDHMPAVYTAYHLAAPQWTAGRQWCYWPE